jgi:uncharacterized protein DUF4349
MDGRATHRPVASLDMDSEQLPGKGTIAAILGGIAAIALVGLLLMGGQVSSILSNVGNALPPGDTTAGGTSGTAAQPATDDSDGKNDPVIDPAAATELLIIRTGQLTIEVGDLDAAVAQARAKVEAVGGFVSGSDRTSDGESAAASATFRIPADRWDDALAAVQGLATATRNLHVETAAVTNQVIDLGARITNLRATEAALQKIMEQATKIPDVLDVQSKLTDVRGEIERLAAQKAHLEEQAAFGTLIVTFVLPVPPVVEEAKAGWDPAADADAATGALIGMGQRLASLGIWVAIVGVPIAIGLGILLAFVFLAWRLGRRSGADAIEP